MMAENDAVEEETAAAETTIIEEADDSEGRQLTAEPKQSTERKKRRDSPALRQIVSWFAACGRCSFFLAGYRLIGDEDALETAVANRGKKWLTVPWSHALADLVHKSYGSRTDIDSYYLEGQCLECQRRFTYRGAEAEEKPGTFRIELKP